MLPELRTTEGAPRFCGTACERKWRAATKRLDRAIATARRERDELNELIVRGWAETGAPAMRARALDAQLARLEELRARRLRGVRT